MATVLVAFAITLDAGAAPKTQSNAGNVRSVPPPAIELTAPARNAETQRKIQEFIRYFTND